MKLYYFTETKWALEALKNQRLKVSNFNDLNDPFELLSPVASDKVNREIFKRNKNRIADAFRLICFSERFLSPVMWAHYAMKHTGMVLEFEILDSLVEKVNYEQTRPVIDHKEYSKWTDEKLFKFTRDIMTAKYEEWSYEEEWRFLLLESEVKVVEVPIKCGNVKKLEFMEFAQDFRLIGLHKGSLNNTPDDEIRQSIPKGEAIIVTNARLAFNSYSIVSNQVSKGRRLQSF
jgi:hypothetical protein